MMEAARTYETLVNFYQTTRRYNPEDSHLSTHRRENLKSYLILCWFKMPKYGRTDLFPRMSHIADSRIQSRKCQIQDGKSRLSHAQNVGKLGVHTSRTPYSKLRSTPSVHTSRTPYSKLRSTPSVHTSRIPYSKLRSMPSVHTSRTPYSKLRSTPSAFSSYLFISQLFFCFLIYLITSNGIIPTTPDVRGNEWINL
jgi:hypothetical protein